MRIERLNATDLRALDEVLGYINFSTGKSDRQFLANLNHLYRAILQEQPPSTAEPPQPWRELSTLLLLRLGVLEQTVESFRDATQAREVIDLVHNHVLAAYREFHRDLLPQEQDDVLFGPLFLGRVYEAALRQRLESGAGREVHEEVADIVARLNDYVGHRPVPALETQKTEPYAHEWHRPVPLYIHGVGAAVGPYEALIARAIDILKQTDPQLLHDAQLDPELMEEVALDARAYDFDHPANKRPNYQFGHWDPHHIDNQGRYRRFVVRQMMLDALLKRVEEPSDVPPDERLFEAAAALCGTMLMAAEMGGAGPDAYSSDISLSTLLPRIAGHRDRFYEELLKRDFAGQARLLQEAETRRQPLGGVRQYLNAELARQRAAQLEHVHLARLYARLGQTEAAERQVAEVSTARARMVCQIQCLINTAQLALDGGDVRGSARALDEAVDNLHRAVQCGAVVDPWNMLGFDGNFSLFPALENSVHDHRIDELLELIDQLLALYARSVALSAAGDDAATQRQVTASLGRLSTWWDQFASMSFSGIDGVAAAPVYQSATAAATALAAWHRGGTTAGDIAFWQPHAEQFESPKAFVLVVDALLDKRDFVASMALLMHWLGQAARVGLQEGSDSFHTSAGRWLRQLFEEPPPAAPQTGPNSADTPESRWKLASKFFDFLEANAEEYWHVPRLEVKQPPAAGNASAAAGIAEDPRVEEDEDDLFSAAYDDMIYRDSSDDGTDAELLGSGPGPTDHELQHESRRIADRLGFLVTLARLWRYAAERLALSQPADAAQTQRLGPWLSRALEVRRDLDVLLLDVSRYQIPKPSGSFESLLEFDRRRWTKDSLSDRVAAACVAYDEAAEFLMAAGPAGDRATTPPLQAAITDVLRAGLRGDLPSLRSAWPALLESLESQPLLYVPLSKGGDAERVVAARSLQRTLRLLLGLLPRLGLLCETVELLRLSARMEQSQTVFSGAVTEFDQLLKIANQALAQSLVASSAAWARPAVETAAAASDTAASDTEENEPDSELVDVLEMLTQAVLVDWLAQSRTVRLSVLEKVGAETAWQKLVDLVRVYGSDLFLQQFLHLGNLRGILHRGVEAWLNDVQREESDSQQLKLIQAIHDGTAPKRAAEMLQLILEAVVENYTEYRDYNSTTTQSDRGELLYMFLDLLRLRVQYDRIDWNVTPVVQVHEILVRNRRTVAAEMWRQELSVRTEEIASQLLNRLDALQREYGMRLPTVTDRLRERFVRPLLVDRARALVRGTIEELRSGAPSESFAQLELEVDELTREPTGVGLDVPAWLETLHDEVDQARWSDFRRGLYESMLPDVPPRLLSRDEVEAQLQMICETTPEDEDAEEEEEESE